MLYSRVVTLRHPTNGSPSCPCWHLHTALWLITSHSALEPQAPGHGSRHLLLMQTRLEAHSLWILHSGLQFGGEPMCPGRQEHATKVSWGLHRENGPHGSELHGSTGAGGWVTLSVTKIIKPIFWGTKENGEVVDFSVFRGPMDPLQVFEFHSSIYISVT